MNRTLSRRGVLRGVLAGAGAVAGARLSSAGGWIGEAHAQSAEPPTVVLVYFNGGFNALFCCAKDLVSTPFRGDPLAASADVFVDRTTLGQLPARALGMMSVIGVPHGISAHPSARAALWGHGKTSYAIELAAALGGASAFRAVTIGNAGLPDNVGLAPVDGVSAQQVRDLGVFSSVLGASKLPARALEAAIGGAETASEARFAASPGKLSGLRDAYQTVLANVRRPVAGIDAGTLPGLMTAYGLTSPKLANDDLTAHFAGAELAILAGAKVVTIMSPGWDSHGDVDGSEVRRKMLPGVIPGLTRFLNRMVLGEQAAGRNVVVCLFGDFSRSLQASGHQPNLSACVIGKHVQPGTTGAVNARDLTLKRPVTAPGDQPAAIGGMWAYLAAAARCATEPFGKNPHRLIKG